MANKKITELDAATSLASTDVVPVVDVSEDVTKKITATNLFRTLPDGTAAAPSLAFGSDAANGLFLAGTDTVGISTGGTQRVTVDGSGNVTISGGLTVEGQTTTVESTIVTIDDKNIELGSVASPSNTTADGGGITLKGATDKTIKWINSTGYWTFNTGIDVGGNIELADNSKIKLGTGDDLEIYHDGSTSFIKDVGTGVLAITSNGGHIALLNGDQTENLAKFIVDGAAELYHNGAKKFETLSTGASVTGNLGIGGTVVTDSNLLNLQGSSASANIGVVFNDTNTSKIYGIQNGGSALKFFDYTASAERMRIDSSGNILVGTTDSTIYNNGDSDSEGIVLRDGEVVDIARKGDLQLTLNRQTNDGHHIGFFRSGSPKSYIATRSDGFCIDVNSSERFRIDSSGRLLLGTTTEGEATADNFTIADSGHCGMTVRSGTSSEGNIFFSDGTSGDAEYRGAVRYFHSLDALTLTTSATERLRIDSSGRVAIGANNPSAYDTSAGNLLVSDTSANCGITIRSGGGTPFGMIHFADGTSSNAEKRAGRIVYGHSGDFMTFNTADSEALRINSSGNVGVGTTSPTAGNSGARFLHLHNSNTSGPAAAEIHFTNGTTGTGTGTGGLVTYYENKLYTWNYEANSLIFGTNNSEKARIDSSGRLMIGTSTEGQANADDLTVASSGHTGITVRSGTTNNGSLFFSDGTSGDDEFRGYVQYNHSDNRLVFGTNAAERLRIDSSGNVGIGNASPVNSTGYNTLTIGNGTNTGGQIHLEASNGNNFQIWHSTTDVNFYAAQSVHQRFYTAGSERLRIDSSGRLLLGTTTEGNADADDFTVAGSANTGITIRSGTSSSGNIFFSDATSGNGEWDGYIQYRQGDRALAFATANTERLRITSTGAWAIEGASNYGTSGQVLTSNGNDSPTWQSPSAGAQITAGNTNVECVDTGSNGHITFDTEGAERMRISAAGQLWLGATDGNYDLEVKKAGARNVLIGSTDANGVTLVLDGDSNGDGLGGDYAYLVHTSAGNLEYVNLKSGQHIFKGTSGTERMRIDSSGRVLIGATAAANATTFLTVQNGSGDAQITLNSGPTSESVINMGDTGDFNIGAIRYNQTDNAFRFFTSNAERMRITSTGIGIGGVTSPFDKLQVRTATDCNFVFSSAGGTEASFEIFNNAGSANTPLNYRASEHKFKIQANEKMRLDSSGRLLLGTSSARQNFYNNTSTPTKFQIEGTSYTSSSMAIVRNSNNGSDAEIVIGKTRSGSVGGYGVVQNGDHIGAISFQGADGSELVEAASILAVVDSAPGSNDMPGRLVFSTTADGAATPTERMRITSGGQVLAGTSSGDGTAHIFAMSAPSSYAFKIHNTNSNNSVATLGLKIKYDVSPNDTNNAIELQVGNGSPFVVRNNGNVQNTNGSFTSFSDARYKENIVDASSQWEDIKNTRIRNWNFRPELGWATHTMLGPVAQELELVSPGLVVDNPVLDDNNNPTGEVQKSVNQSVLYMKAVKALQEAMARIEQLEAKVAALEAS